MTPPEILLGVSTGVVADDPSDDIGCVCAGDVCAGDESDTGLLVIPFSPVDREINV
jgi:hypothetical protein